MPTSSFDKAQILAWIRSDYDYYQECERCGRREGIGERYE